MNLEKNKENIVRELSKAYDANNTKLKPEMKMVLTDIESFIVNHPDLFEKTINEIDLKKKIEDKYVFIPGQIVELKLYESGTVPVIITKVHPKDENGHNTYDCVLFLTGSITSTIHTYERYLWRFVEKKGNVKRLKNYINTLIQNENGNLEYLSNFFEGREHKFFIVENGKISTITFNLV